MGEAAGLLVTEDQRSRQEAAGKSSDWAAPAPGRAAARREALFTGTELPGSARRGQRAEGRGHRAEGAGEEPAQGLAARSPDASLEQKFTNPAPARARLPGTACGDARLSSCNYTRDPSLRDAETEPLT